MSVTWGRLKQSRPPYTPYDYVVGAALVGLFVMFLIVARELNWFR